VIGRLVEGLLAAALAALSSVVALWPARRLGGLTRLLTAALLPFAGKDRRQLRANVEAVYGLRAGTHFSQAFERQVYAHQVRCALETLRVIRGRTPEVTGKAELEAHVAAAEAGGRGHVLVTAHLGSWELCAAYAQRAGTKPLHVLAKPPRSRFEVARRFLERLRRKMGVSVLWTDQKNLLKEMLGALRRGEALGFVMDQKPEGRQGPVVDFLGLPTPFVAGPAKVVARTGAAVVAIFCVREGPFRFRILSETLFPAGHGETDELALTRAMAAAIDRAIRLYPEQWTWGYKRWRLAVEPAPVSAPDDVETGAVTAGL
jgi:KDO2-lipid IV(A) lauroyltransferase